MKVFFFIVLFLVHCDSALPLLPDSQAPKVRVSGCVEDSAGASLPHVVIVFKNKNNRSKVEVVTAQDGRYEVFLSPGKYQMQAEIKGCTTFRQKEVHLQPENDRVIDVTLKCAATPIYEK